ncbi:protein degradation-related protein FYV10-like protein [Parastagonospora nodorum]|nr:protein degradation-related protein FYV10-like protein [Parastagonospora nodorum]KAH3958310.1 protein degradation-related protein FYV10-like protein [Parastagonospora nodorum]KAH5341706.1 protein degradation-related protein FYV10-like protein [Parastagonospora nodorum]KAH5588497.1 protein degradation-related protein FYV10-like protein [Parastagonospora nodorum]KAH5724980.1 protein degradation-related protein FYV10-like protein [Parastagonospora nodorum]
MAELTSMKLNAESHLLLDQPLLRMPYELSRRNFKNAQRVIEHSSANMTTSLAAATKAASKSASPDATLDSLDAMISKMQALKRKLEGLHEEETRIHKSAKARLRHLQDLYDVNSLVDVKYDEWSRTRLSRLLVDYLLREGYSESAAHLAQSKEIEDLVDVDAFVACHKIERSLREGMSTSLALDWCKEHSKELKKGGSMLEFELRLQQYIELVRQGHEAGLSDMDGIEGHGMNGVSLGTGGGETKLVEARVHAKKYLSTSGDFELLRKAAGLLAYKPWDDVEPYVSLYSPSRWAHLANLFLSTHHNLYSLPPRPLLHIALSAGLSALKTPACHSAYTSSSANASSATTSVCPICSTELNELARNVPYAHHTKSIVKNDPVVLPNGRIYGRDQLTAFNKKVGTESGWVRDPVDGIKGEAWSESEVRKVYIM